MITQEIIKAFCDAVERVCDASPFDTYEELSDGRFVRETLPLIRSLRSAITSNRLVSLLSESEKEHSSELCTAEVCEICANHRLIEELISETELPEAA